VSRPVNPWGKGWGTGRPPRVTVANVNAALRAAGIDAELLKGRGYFYFGGPAVELCYTTSVPTMHLRSLSVEQWLDEARRFAAETAAARA